jgi:hypothetical protein
LTEKQRQTAKQTARELYMAGKISLEMAIWAMKNAGYSRKETAEWLELNELELNKPKLREAFMIELSKLTEHDRGREVVFDSPGSKMEFGIVSSWNDRFIFVKYNGSQQSQATNPEDLRFSMGQEAT